MSIRPDYFTLDQLLTNRLFRIPHYQRAYSWQRKHRDDMFKDIKKLKGAPNGSFHFMATVVGLLRDTKTIITDKYNIIEIVDGQQRLTTLVLLLKAIENKLDRSAPDEERLAQDLQELLVKSDDASLVLLQTNHDRSQYFANFLRSGEYPSVETAQTLADRELLSAIHECESFVDSWENGRIELAGIIKNQLTFIFHEIDDEAAVYTVFEVLNNRGLSVTPLDRLKTMLMSIAFEDDQGNKIEHINELHQIWGDIYATIGLRQGIGTEVLKYGGTLEAPYRTSKPIPEDHAIAWLGLICKNAAEAIDNSNWLLKVAKAINKFLEHTSTSRKIVGKIAHAKFLAVAIILRNFPATQQEILLDEWEKTTFYIFGLCRKDARTAVGDYVRLACDIWTNTDLNVDDISKKVNQIKLSKGLALEWVFGQVENQNCYNTWEEQLRYLLFRYEEYLAEQQGQTFKNEQWDRIWQVSAAKSIEHILPQSLGSHEPLMASNERVFVHRLGNLLLLPPNVNSQLSDKTPEEKADSYINTGLLIAKEVGQTIKQSGWGADEVQEREQRLLEWIRWRWS